FTMLGGRTTLLPARRRTTLPDQATVARAVAEFQIASDVDQALRQAAERMDATPPPQRPERLEQTKRSVWTHGLTTIHQASNRGATWFAEQFGLGLRWYTRRDNRVCWACGPMHGRTVASADQSFVLPPGPRWRGYTGKPPAHPRCRRSVRPGRFRASRSSRGATVGFATSSGWNLAMVLGVAMRTTAAMSFHSTPAVRAWAMSATRVRSSSSRRGRTVRSTLSADGPSG